MLKFYYNPKYKYTNRQIIDVSEDSNFREIDYQNIDSPDTINGHIIYQLEPSEKVPTYIVDTENDRRYFVSGITQLRTGKFQLSLIRDIISESPDTWKSEDAYIQAGTAQDYNKYKRWDLPFTNTKIKEQRLDINGKSSFFVFYANEQHLSSAGVLTEDDLKISSSIAPGYTGYDYTVTRLADIPYFSDYVNQGTVRAFSTCNTVLRLLGTKQSLFNYNKLTGALTWSQGNFTASNRNYIEFRADINVIVNYNANNNFTSIQTAMANFTNNYTQSGTPTISQTAINSLGSYVNKIIYSSSDSKIYTIKLATVNRTYDQLIPTSDTSSLRSALNSINWARPSGTTGISLTDNRVMGDGFVQFNATETEYVYTLEELGNAISFDFTFAAAQPKLPKSSVKCVNIVSSDDVSDMELAQALMLAQTNPTTQSDVGRIIDVQYLPFRLAEDTELDASIVVNGHSMPARFLVNDDYQYVTDMDDLTNINKETDTIKVVSPSRASQFLFRPYDNNGNMLFQTKITLRPYSSIIYIRPSTQGLLIQDWDDKDCLIINEDFSLTQITSDWVNYVYQNRNYQNAFNRQIQGREFERTWERRVEQAQMKADDWTSRNISSQKAQTYTGNLPLVSGIAGAIGSAFQDSAYMQAAQLDREYNEALYQESISIAQDQFTYQLDNLKAQPNLPSQITTIDAKFLDGVYLEFYSTNESELNSIKKFYEFNGNRIDAYGTFNDYYGWFVRGKLIRANNYTQPEFDELNRRLGTGIFTEVEYD